MSRPLRLSLVLGCALLGALHLPEAARALGEGLHSPLREVRAMERSGATALARDPASLEPPPEAVAHNR